jgi:hypothetical protein
MKILTLVLILSITIASVGCGGMVTAAEAQNSAHPPGFTQSSKIFDQGNGFYDIGAEFLAPAGFSKADLPFTITPGATVTHFHATASWNAACVGDVLAVLVIDGHRVTPIILKTAGGAQNLMVNYDIPYPTGTGAALLHVEANPGCAGHYANMNSFEIQGTLEVQ